MSKGNKSVLFQGNQFSDWPAISATNPIDCISLSLNDSPNELIEFEKKHEGKFLAGFISYEFGAKELGVPYHELGGNIPAVHFRAFDDYQRVEMSSTCSGKWGRFKPGISKKEYALGFDKIKNYIR
ncbi:hypothetical protein JYT44_01795, partial [Caldithrix abyssi]|nr:hypothetical protein [Caldithrix abyssi]